MNELRAGIRSLPAAAFGVDPAPFRASPMRRFPRPRDARQRRIALAAINLAFAVLIAALLATGLPPQYPDSGQTSSIEVVARR